MFVVRVAPSSFLGFQSCQVVRVAGLGAVDLDVVDLDVAAAFGAAGSQHGTSEGLAEMS